MILIYLKSTLQPQVTHHILPYLLSTEVTISCLVFRSMSASKQWLGLGTLAKGICHIKLNAR